MPLIWRLILRNYFYTILLCIIGFVSILLVIRSQEITRLIALTSQYKAVGLFIFCQIPYILPIAIPISGLIASILLAQRLSQTHELTALRTCGISLKTLKSPLYFSAFLIACCNFVIIADITPRFRSLSQSIIQQASTINPLVLIKKSSSLKTQDLYSEMEMENGGGTAKNILLITHNPSDERLNLLIAKECNIEKNTIKASDTTLIFNRPSKSTTHDNLFIENQSSLIAHTQTISDMITPPPANTRIYHLPANALIRIIFDKTSSTSLLHSAYIECCRRIFFPCITFLLTILGFSLGLQLGRKQKKTGIYYACGCTIITFLCSVSAKSLQSDIKKVLICYLIPLLIIPSVTYFFEKRITNGIE